MDARSGFRELAHTADWELEVWAPDLPGLLEQAARGMCSLAGIRLQPGPRQMLPLELSALDAESLLVRFLSELLWLSQQQNLAFDEFQLSVDAGFNLRGQLSGAAIASLNKEIKAVTYHNLVIRQTSQGLAANLVFDV